MLASPPARRCLCFPSFCCLRGLHRRAADVFCAVVLAAVTLFSSANGAAYAPYGLDSSTLHLWHLNDTAVPAVIVVKGLNKLPLNGLLTNATFAGAALTGLGTSLLVNSGNNTGGILLAAAVLADGDGDDVVFSHADPTTGAFLNEAVIRDRPHRFRGGCPHHDRQ
jgi:hypothetical protein